MVRIKNLEQAKAIIAELRAERDALLIKAQGVRSDGTIDRYTDMNAAELRELIEKRGGDVESIVKGYHSRARSIRMREFLRGMTSPKKRKPKTVEAAPVTKKAKKRPPVAVETPVKKRKPKVVEAPPVKKRKPRVVEAPPVKAKKKKPRQAL